MSNYLRNSAILATLTVIGMTGCTSKDTMNTSSNKVMQLQEEIEAQNAKISQLELDKTRALNSIQAMNIEANDKNAVSNSLVPANAVAGECYAKV